MQNNKTFEKSSVLQTNWEKLYVETNRQGVKNEQLGGNVN